MLAHGPFLCFQSQQGASSLIPDLCSHHHFSFSSLTLPLSLIKTLVIALGPCRSSRLISHLKILNLITPTKSPCHSQVLRIKMRTSLGTLVCLPRGNLDVDLIEDIVLSTTWGLGSLGGEHTRSSRHYAMSNVSNIKYLSLVQMCVNKEL